MPLIAMNREIGSLGKDVAQGVAESLGLAEKIRRSKIVDAISSYCRSQLKRRTDHDAWPKVNVDHCGV